MPDEPMLSRVFDRCYRRFCLGPCRVRTSDYSMHSFCPPGRWSVESGPARLADRAERGEPVAEARLRFGDSDRTASFVLRPDLPVPSESIDRVFVSYRGDQTWAEGLLPGRPRRPGLPHRGSDEPVRPRLGRDATSLAGGRRRPDGAAELPFPSSRRARAGRKRGVRGPPHCRKQRLRSRLRRQSPQPLPEGLPRVAVRAIHNDLAGPEHSEHRADCVFVQSDGLRVRPPALAGQGPLLCTDAGDDDDPAAGDDDPGLPDLSRPRLVQQPSSAVGGSGVRLAVLHLPAATIPQDDPAGPRGRRPHRRLRVPSRLLGMW